MSRRQHPRIPDPTRGHARAPVPSAAGVPAPVPDAGNSVFERMLIVDEVADLLQLSSRHVRRMIASGELPVVRFGRVVRVRPVDLAARIRLR